MLKRRSRRILAVARPVTPQKGIWDLSGDRRRCLVGDTEGTYLEPRKPEAGVTEPLNAEKKGHISLLFVG